MAVHEWLQRDWLKLCAQLEKGLLAHAYLFNGMPGIGKHDFTLELISFVLCSDASKHDRQSSCGQCKSCLLAQSSTHPDVKFISPEEGSSSIKVDSVRGMVEFFSQSAMQGGKKIALIEPAEALNVNAANALLKTLEEPSGDSLLILVSHSSGQLLPTIRSRCQVVDLASPTESQSCRWLASNGQYSESDVTASLVLANRAPLLAKKYLELSVYDEYCKMLDELASALKRATSVSVIAQRWGDDIAETRLGWIIYWIESLLKLKIASEALPLSYQAKMFEHLAERNSAQTISETHCYLLKQLRLLQGTSNPNKQLLFEVVILRLIDLMAR